MRQSLNQLVGLTLAVARRAANIRVFHFGSMRPAAKSDLPSLRDKPRGSIGDFALHIQCPWRIETNKSILTGDSDLWEPLDRSKGLSYDNWNDDTDGNLQDQLIEQFMSHNDNLIVKNVDCRPNCTFTLTFAGDYRLIVFPSGSTGEDWRLFRPESDESHFVVFGGAIECEDSRDPSP